MVVSHDPTLELAIPPVHDPKQAILAAEQAEPDVVLMDVVFRGCDMDGIEATRRIKEVSPATKVVIMTAHEEDPLLVAAVEAGAAGFLPKSEAIDGLLQAVRAAADGEQLIDPATLERIMRKVRRERRKRKQADAALAELTDREREVLERLARGERNDAIAASLGISPQTVQTHVRNILRKLGVHSKLEAVAFAVRHGAVSV